MPDEKTGKYSWERISRKNLVDSKFIKVYEDTVKIPGYNSIIDDYTVVTLNSPVLIVAVDSTSRVLVIHEYRYAHNAVMPSLPAGAIDSGETAIEAGERELLEETGYIAESFEYIGELYEYPTKLDHITHVVLARGIKRVAEPYRETTEYIETMELVTIERLKGMIKSNEIKTAAIISALYLALKEFEIQ